MAYVNFTLNEIMYFWMAVSNMSSAVQNEVNEFESAAEAAISKYRALIDMYNESLNAMDTDYREYGFVINDNKEAIKTLERRRNEAKKTMDTAPDESREAAKKNYHTAQQNLEDAIRLNEELERAKDALWRNMETCRTNIRNFETAISTLNHNKIEMQKAGDVAIRAIYGIQEASNTAQEYGDKIIDNLKEDDSTASNYHDLRVRFHDHTVLLHISDGLASLASRLGEKTTEAEEATDELERSMSDRITRATVIKMREINADTCDAGANLVRMAKKSRVAYGYVVDYLNLKKEYH